MWFRTENQLILVEGDGVYLHTKPHPLTTKGWEDRGWKMHSPIDYFWERGGGGWRGKYLLGLLLHPTFHFPFYHFHPLFAVQKEWGEKKRKSEEIERVRYGVCVVIRLVECRLCGVDGGCVLLGEGWSEWKMKGESGLRNEWEWGVGWSVGMEFGWECGRWWKRWWKGERMADL
jgi:hypothetical protein